MQITNACPEKRRRIAAVHLAAASAINDLVFVRCHLELSWARASLPPLLATGGYDDNGQCWTTTSHGRNGLYDAALTDDIDEDAISPVVANRGRQILLLVDYKLCLYDERSGVLEEMVRMEEELDQFERSDGSRLEGGRHLAEEGLLAVAHLKGDDEAIVIGVWLCRNEQQVFIPRRTIVACHRVVWVSRD
ncbi:hypothetical protein E2562_014990 [Oryza meyeriana var. granulata]|uniref:Uncharacterized protein n=1 Tax=Oryza meyeriana var. granulata TaxID=110450 RepID=A0A6G1EKH7_9ORYZ|nr:hypothetical protein E2562_014990 [Oryza meyeriana var. granulata]